MIDLDEHTAELRYLHGLKTDPVTYTGNCVCDGSGFIPAPASFEEDYYLRPSQWTAKEPCEDCNHARD